MGKRSIALIAGIAVILSVTLFLKGFAKPEEVKKVTFNDKTDIKSQYYKLKNSGMPSIVVFTYDADC